MGLLRASVTMLLVSICLATAVSADPILIDRGEGGAALTPSLGLFPLDATGSPYSQDFAVVLAGSFLFGGQTGTMLTSAGAWMSNLGDLCSALLVPCPGSRFQFRVFADNNHQPDPNRELGFSPDFFQLADNSSPWTLEKGQLQATAPGSLTLVSQTEYWIAVSTIGAVSEGAYAVALAPGIGHTYLAFDPALVGFFDFVPAADANLAIYAEGIPPVPEPGSVILVATGAGLMCHFRYRRWLKLQARHAKRLVAAPRCNRPERDKL